MRSLITGGAGFIGSHVAYHYIKLGHEVVVLDDLSGGHVDQIPRGAEFVRGSITDATLINELFEKYDFDYVYHLAAYAAEGLSHFIRRFNYQNNLIGSVNLINASVLNKVKRFVFASSIAVYGAGQLPMTENMIPLPEDPYGISKYAVELDLRAAHELFGLNYVVFRPHNVYGEHQNIGDRYRNVIGIFMNQIMNKQPLTIFGDGQQTRAFSYIDDVAPYISQSVHIEAAQNQTINIGADQPYSILELAETVAAAFNVTPDIQHLAARNEVLHAYSDHSKAQKIFSITRQVPLSLGIERMANWARRVGSRATTHFEDIEVPIGLPASWSVKQLQARGEE